MKNWELLVLFVMFLSLFFIGLKLGVSTKERQKKEVENQLKLCRDSLNFSREKSYYYFEVSSKVLEINNRFKSSREALYSDSTYLHLLNKDFN